MSYGEHKDNNGFFYKEWRDDKGLDHREDGPAYLCYRADGIYKRGLLLDASRQPHSSTFCEDDRKNLYILYNS